MEITKVELAGAKRIIEEHPRNSLGWYIGCILWNRVVTMAEDDTAVKAVGRPFNADFPEGNLIVMPEFDMAQRLMRLN